MTGRALDLSNQKFGRLTALYPIKERRRGRIVWHCQCECGNHVDVVVSDLTTGDTISCGCLKKEQDQYKLSKHYDAKRVDGVAMQLFKDKEPRKDSTTGYRGVSDYRTRQSKELRYRAWITVAGKRHYKSGFLTPEDAYYHGRLLLEQRYLPKKD